MTLYRSFSPDNEVLGSNILTYISSMGSFDILGEQIMKAHGLSNIDPAAWYNQQTFLDAVKDIYEKTGPKTLLVIGRNIASRYKIQSNSKDGLMAALETLDAGYHVNHRGVNIGFKRFKVTGANTAEVTVQTPYPCELDMGIIRNLVERCVPDGSISVTHNEKSICRKRGSEFCLYSLEW